jgi:limonene 1,2-monooxygenase
MYYDAPHGLRFGQLDVKEDPVGPLTFGYVMARFHRPGTNPTLALQLDPDFVENIDALGFDEVWIGEHHSAGSEIISSPEIFIAAAAQRTKRIRLGTGVISLAYHNRCGLPIS